MYKYDIPHLPIEIKREEFIDIVFELGYYKQYRHDTIITAVQIADYFVSYDQQRKLYVPSSEYEFMSESVSQIYSKELGHVVITISSGVNEDIEYNIKMAAIETENSYVYKMQWEICMTINFEVRMPNFMTLIHHLISILYQNENGEIQIHSIFWDLSRAICMDRKYLKMKPVTVLLGIILLHNKGKLKVNSENRKRIFQNIVVKASHEYEIPLSKFLKVYIEMKRKSVEE